MAGSRIDPEKVNHPIQLMAAWFVMLVLLDGSFLTAAHYVDKPSWVPAFLCVSALVIAILVTCFVFLMLTKYRPHLQDSRDYAEWLKDERRWVRRQTVEGTFSVPLSSIGPDANADLSKLIPAYRVEVADLPDSDQVMASLADLGFRSSRYREPLYDADQRREHRDSSAHEAIWLGDKVPASVALAAIKAALKYWPHLKYVDLSGDHSEEAPGYIHFQLFLGGSTSSAKEFGLRPWSKEELLAIPGDISTEKLHELVRSRYGRAGRTR